MVLVAAVEALNSTLGKAVGKLENIISTSEQAQKATLSLGQSLGGGFNSLGQSLDDLNGTFGERLQVGIAGMQAGLQGNTAGILKLLNEQQLLGQNFKLTAKTVAKLESTLGFSRKESVNLARTLSDTSKQFGVSIELLVKAVDGIKNLPALRAAGLGGFASVVGQAAGQFGPALQGELSKFVSLLTDTSMEAYAKLTMLGIGDIREQLASAAGDSSKQLSLFMRALDRAGVTVKRFAEGSDEFFSKLSIPVSLFGDVSMSLLALSQNLGTRDQIEARNRGDFRQQLSVIRNNLFAPLELLFSQKVFPQFSKFVGILAESVQPLLSSLSEKIKALGDSTSFFDNLLKGTNKVIQFGIRIINMFIDVINRNIHIFNLARQAINLILLPSRLLSKVFNKVRESILDLVEFINVGGIFDGVVDMFDTPQISKLDPEMFNLEKAQERLLAKIAENTDSTDEQIRNVPNATESLRESMRVLDRTLFQISREAVGSTVQEDMVELLRAVETNTAATAENNSLPSAGSNL